MVMMMMMILIIYIFVHFFLFIYLRWHEFTLAFVSLFINKSNIEIIHGVYFFSQRHSNYSYRDCICQLSGQLKRNNNNNNSSFTVKIYSPQIKWKPKQRMVAWLFFVFFSFHFLSSIDWALFVWTVITSEQRANIIVRFHTNDINIIRCSTLESIDHVVFCFLLFGNLHNSPYRHINGFTYFNLLLFLFSTRNNIILQVDAQKNFRLTPISLSIERSEKGFIFLLLAPFILLPKKFSECVANKSKRIIKGNKVPMPLPRFPFACIVLFVPSVAVFLFAFSLFKYFELTWSNCGRYW